MEENVNVVKKKFDIKTIIFIISILLILSFAYSIVIRVIVGPKRLIAASWNMRYDENNECVAIFNDGTIYEYSGYVTSGSFSPYNPQWVLKNARRKIRRVPLNKIIKIEKLIEEVSEEYRLKNEKLSFMTKPKLKYLNNYSTINEGSYNIETLINTTSKNDVTLKKVLSRYNDGSGVGNTFGNISVFDSNYYEINLGNIVYHELTSKQIELMKILKNYL